MYNCMCYSSYFTLLLYMRIIIYENFVVVAVAEAMRLLKSQGGVRSCGNKEQLQPADQAVWTDLNDNSSKDPHCHWSSEASEPVVEVRLAKREWVKACIALQYRF